MKRLRILLVGNHLSGSIGHRSPIEDLGERLTARGHECHSVSRLRNGFLRGADMMLTAVGRRNHYDVAIVDLYSGRAFLWGESLSHVFRSLKKPFIFTLHGGGLPEFATGRRSRVAACLRRANAVTAPSGFLVQGMREYRSDIRLIPNPLDIVSWPYRHRSSLKPHLVWIRSFHRIYNPVMAAHMMKALLREIPTARLTMVGADKGDGSFSETVAAAEKLGISERITFTGGVPRGDLPRLLDQADIFVNTTNFDNTPVSILEAMACGLCVVSTNAGGVPWLIDHGRNGLMVPLNDPAAMASEVASLLRDSALAARLSSEAHATAMRCDWSLVLPEWERLLEQVSAAKAGSGATAGNLALLNGEN